jgi:hypothetical protein
MAKGIFVVAALVAMSLPARAYELRKDSAGQPVRWTQRVRFVVDPRLPDQLQEPRAIEAVEAAVATFRDELPSLDVRFEQDHVEGLGYDNDGTVDRNSIQVPASWPFRPDALAVTVVTVDDRTHEIVDADVALNPAQVFRVLGPNGGPGGTNDLQNTITHELGHAFGLAHNAADPAVVMYPFSAAGETVKRRLSADDLAGLDSLYAIVDESRGCTASGGGSLALLAFALVLLARSWRRFARALVAMMLVGSTSLAAPVEAPLIVAHVESTRTIAPEPGRPMLLFTELTLRTDRCSGACPETLTLRVPGGRWDHVEQWVDDAPVPHVGEALRVELRGEGAVLRTF